MNRNRTSKSGRIFFITNTILDGKNAQTTHVIELFINLKKRERDIIVFAPKPKNIIYKNEEIIYIPIPKIDSIFSQFLYQIFLFFYLVFHSIIDRPLIFYVRLSIPTFSPLIVSKIFKIPYVVERNDSVALIKSIGFSSKLWITLAKLIERVNFTHATRIIAVTQGLKYEIRELYNIPDERIVVIENGANTDLFKPMSKEKCIKELNLDESQHYVCFVGNLAPWQGVEYLIEAVPLILKKIPNTNFLIVGDGMMKEKLVKLAKKTGISDKIIFTGAVPYEKVPKYINASDVCVAPFIKERKLKIGLSPLKIYEYLSCEKPVVSTQIPNLEFIERENAGILVEPENPKELAKAIVTLLNNRKLRKEMGENGRKYVVKKHSWKIVAKRVAEVCEEVIAT